MKQKNAHTQKIDNINRCVTEENYILIEHHHEVIDRYLAA